MEAASLSLAQSVVCIILAELILRAFPSLIAPAFLVRFPSERKGDIARILGLPTGSDQVRIPSSERTDRGADIPVAKPNSTYLTPADTADVEAGVVEQLQTDALGFCNPRNEPNTSTEILVIGSSMPNCAGVSAESNFSEQLEQITGRSTYNLALGGTGPHEFIELLKRFGLSMKPKVVIMACRETNELRDCQRHQEHVTGKNLRLRSRNDWPFPFSASYALSFMKAVIEVMVKQTMALLLKEKLPCMSEMATEMSCNLHLPWSQATFHHRSAKHHWPSSDGSQRKRASRQSLF